MKLSIENKSIIITHKNNAIGSLLYTLRNGKNIELPHTIKIKNNTTVEADFDNAKIIDTIIDKKTYIIVEREFRIMRAGKWQLLFGYAPDLFGDIQWLIPAVMYQNNQHGDGKFSRGTWRNGWSFREDRISVPSCAMLNNSEKFFVLFTEPADSTNTISSIKTFADANNPILQISVPFVEEPTTYTEKGIFSKGQMRATEEFLHIKKRDLPFVYKRKFYIATGKFVHTTETIKKVFDIAWSEFANPINKTTDWKNIADLKLCHLKFLTREQDDMAYIKMGEGNGIFQSYYEYTAGSFLVKSIEAGLIYARTGDKNNIRLAEKIAKFFIGQQFDNGLHQDMYSLKDKIWGGYLGAGGDNDFRDEVNTRCNGEVMTNYLRLYRLLKSMNIDHNDYLELAQKNADFYITHQLDNGSFGRWWTKDGMPLDTLGTNGAYIINLLIELEKTIGKSKAIDMALKKAGDYYISLVDNNQFYADTLDADCIDKEAGCALLRAFINLYERKKTKKYLVAAQRAASFILSWTFSYDIPFSKNTVCAKQNLKTIGLTSVSVAHHHLDFYGMLIGYDFLRLWRATNDDSWKTYGLAMINACSQLIATKQNPLGKNSDYIGWQPEQINHTNWDYKHRWIGGKGKYDVCVAWTVVLTLGAIYDLRDDFGDEVSF